MIARIEGTIVYMNDKYVIVDTHGVGYKVYITPDTAFSLGLGDTASFWTYTAVRENALDLYGFASIDELGFFEMLLDVSGIGPKSALGIIAVAPISTLQTAIATGDTSYLYKVSGIGKKTAEKIVIELRDKLKAHSSSSAHTTLRAESDVIEALKALGYSQAEARDALKDIPASIEGTNARIKEALKMLGK